MINCSIIHNLPQYLGTVGESFNFGDSMNLSSGHRCSSSGCQQPEPGKCRRMSGMTQDGGRELDCLSFISIGPVSVSIVRSGQSSVVSRCCEVTGSNTSAHGLLLLLQMRPGAADVLHYRFDRSLTERL